METQDAPSEFIFKLWPWLEANRNRLIGLTVAAFVVVAVFSFLSWRNERRETAAGEALTQLFVAPAVGADSVQLAGSFAQVATRYSGTAAGQRAQLQAGAILFSAAHFTEAQAQFQGLLDAHAGGLLAAIADLGVATSLEAQGKLDDAAATYRTVTSQYGETAPALPAKFALGRIAQQQGKFTDALGYFQEIARNNLAGSLASEAAMRVEAIKTRLAAAPKTAIKS
jgi:predicted negative regulator of RcsB-dependent stress response